MSVLVVLGLIWAAVLIPPVLRARAERRAEFIESFRDQMGALGNKAERCMESEDQSRRRRRASPVKRRRDIVGGLFGAMIASLVLGALPSLRIVWVLHLFLLNTLIGYLALLAHQRGLAMRRQAWGVARPVRKAHVPGRQRRRVVEPVLSPALTSRR
ncbi:MAG: hypothetical protein M3314_05730 [Actinomycetota bacterium]|nr:hypothetical protein [Actinomycetota bacterium]